MKKTIYKGIILLFFWLLQIQSANALVRVKAIGTSPKGQYVAFEEYGFKNGAKLPFSKIRVMNVWKGEYVDGPIYIVGENENLQDIRIKVKKLAKKKLIKFDISL